MGYESRRSCCAVLFWMKTTLAILIAVGFMAYMSERVYTKHHDATKPKPIVPINTPLEVIPIDENGNPIGPAVPVPAPDAAPAVARRSFNVAAAHQAFEMDLSGFRSLPVASS
ncbi:hypothetical protein HDU86_002107 [Geranomyces michiganensis]|nr:hypothetical protein HDU86_002107 [Geranomyces michiganensis]